MRIALVAAALAAAIPAFAAETRCPEVAKDKVLPAQEIQSRLAAKGYDVSRVKREGSCYEVKAKKDGKRVKAYVSPADASIVSEKTS